LTVLFLACASTAGASGFTFDSSPELSTTTTKVDSSSGSGLLTVCGDTLASSSGCSSSSVLNPGVRSTTSSGNASTLLQTAPVDFAFVSSGHTSLATFSFLAAVTDNGPGSGYTPFTGSEIATNVVPAMNFLSSFNGQTGPISTLGKLPEPASLTLFGTGLVLLLRRRLFRKKTSVNSI
jgi:hypothetical protein